MIVFRLVLLTDLFTDTLSDTGVQCGIELWWLTLLCVIGQCFTLAALVVESWIEVECTVVIGTTADATELICVINLTVLIVVCKV